MSSIATARVIVDVRRQRSIWPNQQQLDSRSLDRARQRSELTDQIVLRDGIRDGKQHPAPAKTASEVDHPLGIRLVQGARHNVVARHVGQEALACRLHDLGRAAGDGHKRGAKSNNAGDPLRERPLKHVEGAHGVGASERVAAKVERQSACVCREGELHRRLQRRDVRVQVGRDAGVELQPAADIARHTRNVHQPLGRSLGALEDESQKVAVSSACSAEDRPLRHLPRAAASRAEVQHLNLLVDSRVIGALKIEPLPDTVSRVDFVTQPSQQRMARNLRGRQGTWSAARLARRLRATWHLPRLVCLQL